MSFNENTLRENRIQESLGSITNILNETQVPKTFNLIMTSSDDQGVARNLGRKGARFAPSVLIAQLKKMAKTEKSSEILISEVTEKDLSFNEMQQLSIKKITAAIKPEANKIIHLGGGHDHIYPLLKAIDQKDKKIAILNIDAHLDTRNDQHFHSGTPFRQYINEAQGNFSLLQAGIHDFANTISTKDQLGDRVSIQSFDELTQNSNHFTKLGSTIEEFIKQDCDQFIISLDADAIEGSIMEAVSAVNGMGIPLYYINTLIGEISKHQKTTVFGIYEYNPLFDNLSAKGARALSSLMYNYLE